MGYDSNANFEALKVLFDRGQIPMVPLPDLSPVVRDIVEFPALCISFPKGNLEEEVTKHFQPVVETIENYPGVKILKNNGSKDAKLPDIIPTATSNNSKKVEVKRKDFKLKSPFITCCKENLPRSGYFIHQVFSLSMTP